MHPARSLCKAQENASGADGPQEKTRVCMLPLPRAFFNSFLPLFSCLSPLLFQTCRLFIPILCCMFLFNFFYCFPCLHRCPSILILPQYTNPFFVVSWFLACSEQTRPISPCCDYSPCVACFTRIAGEF